MQINRLKLVTELTRRNMTQTKLAELAGISRVTVNNIKCGKTCSEYVGLKIAAALNVPIDTLLEFKEE